MNGTLERFQDDFTAAIYGDADATSTVFALIKQPGFGVYRNTIIKGCIDALQANFPTIERLVGTEWFRAAAAIFVRESRPTNVSLMTYGETFADFLDDFEPAKALPYLADVARLDRFWIESHMARDQQSLNPAALAQYAPEQLGQIVLRPLDAARWAWFESQPIYSIWSVNRDGLSTEDELDWKGEGALLIRQDGVVIWREIGAGTAVFLDACAAGTPLEQAANRAAETEPTLDIAQMLSTLLGDGVFEAID